MKLVDISEFTCIAPHPYGAKPEGNAYFEKRSLSTNRCREPTVSDDLWQSILSYCSGRDLSQFVQTSRANYVAGHQPELWRDLVLHGSQRLVVDKFLRSWKDTYHCRREKRKLKPHVPIPVNGVYSDTYYRTHLCRSFAIPEQWLKPDSSAVDLVSADISPGDFRNRYEYPNRPVILRGAAKSWEAMRLWNDPTYLIEKTVGNDFRATSGAAPLPAQFTLKSYFDYCNTAGLEEAPLYLFDRTALTSGSLRDDYFPDLQRTCPSFDPSRSSINEHDLFQYLGEGRRPDHTWLIVGPKRSGSSFHFDPNATHAWNAAIVGRKRWIFYPPGVTPPGVHPSPSGADVAMPISLGEWILNYWEEHLGKYNDPDPKRRPLECTVEPGDVIFVPHGWWHSVINLDDINVAITHNFVSRSNLPTVLRFLAKKQDQISGCRDREESVKPEFLLDEFSRVLKEKHPEWYAEAQAEAQRGWKCAAWTDDEDVTTSEADHSDKNNICSGTKRKNDADAISNSIISRAKMEDSRNDSSNCGFSFSFLV